MKKLTILCAVVAALGLSASGSVSAAPAPNALSEDAAALADATGLSLANATAQLERQAVLGDVLSNLRMSPEVGDRIIEGRLSGRDDGASLGLTLIVSSDTDGAIRSSVNEQLDALGLVGSAVTIEELGITPEEIRDRQDAVRSAVMNAVGDRAERFYFNAQFSLSGELSAFETDDVDAAHKLLAGSDFAEVPLVPVEGYRDEGYVVAGNGVLQYAGSSIIGRCTAGFTISDVRNGQTVKGVLTAGHCNHEANWTHVGATYWTPPTGTYQVYEGNESPATNRTHDVGEVWLVNSSDHSAVYPQFWTGSQFRNVTSIEPDAGHAIDAFVCAYGNKSTSTKCGWIYKSSNFDPDGFFLSTWLTTDDAVSVTKASGTSETGDSGGPWWNGNEAFGIHSGSAAGRWIYTKVDGPASGFLGVTVLEN